MPEFALFIKAYPLLLVDVFAEIYHPLLKLVVPKSFPIPAIFFLRIFIAKVHVTECYCIVLFLKIKTNSLFIRRAASH